MRQSLSALWLFGALAACAELPSDRSSDPPPATPPGRIARAVSVAPAIPEATLAKLREHLSRSREGLTQVKRADGLTQIDLKGRFHHAHVASRGADGRVHVQCINQPAALDAMLDPRGGSR